jgi:hypothetical protein
MINSTAPENLNYLPKEVMGGISGYENEEYVDYVRFIRDYGNINEPPTDLGPLPPDH